MVCQKLVSTKKKNKIEKVERGWWGEGRGYCNLGQGPRKLSLHCDISHWKVVGEKASQGPGAQECPACSRNSL